MVKSASAVSSLPLREMRQIRKCSMRSNGLLTCIVCESRPRLRGKVARILTVLFMCTRQPWVEKTKRTPAKHKAAAAWLILIKHVVNGKGDCVKPRSKRPIAVNSKDNGRDAPVTYAPIDSFITNQRNVPCNKRELLFILFIVTETWRLYCLMGVTSYYLN